MRSSIGLALLVLGCGGSLPRPSAHARCTVTRNHSDAPTEAEWLAAITEASLETCSAFFAAHREGSALPPVPPRIETSVEDVERQLLFVRTHARGGAVAGHLVLGQVEEGGFALLAVGWYEGPAEGLELVLHGPPPRRALSVEAVLGETRLASLYVVRGSAIAPASAEPITLHGRSPDGTVRTATFRTEGTAWLLERQEVSTPRVGHARTRAWMEHIALD